MASRNNAELVIVRHGCARTPSNAVIVNLLPDIKDLFPPYNLTDAFAFFIFQQME